MVIPTIERGHGVFKTLMKHKGSDQVTMAGVRGLVHHHEHETDLELGTLSGGLFQHSVGVSGRYPGCVFMDLFLR